MPFARPRGTYLTSFAPGRPSRITRRYLCVPALPNGACAGSRIVARGHRDGIRATRSRSRSAAPWPVLRWGPGQIGEGASTPGGHGHWNGARWTAVTSLSPKGLSDVSATSARAPGQWVPTVPLPGPATPSSCAGTAQEGLKAEATRGICLDSTGYGACHDAAPGHAEAVGAGVHLGARVEGEQRRAVALEDGQVRGEDLVLFLDERLKLPGVAVDVVASDQLEDAASSGRQAGGMPIVTSGSSSYTCAVPDGPAILITRWMTTSPPSR